MRRDTRTVDFLEVPEVFTPADGNWDFALEVSHMISEEMKRSPLDRYEIAAQMSRLSGGDVSKQMLDAWASPARSDHNLALHRVPVLEQVLVSHALTDWLVGKRGGKAEYGRDVLKAELGKLTVMRDEADRRVRDLKRLIGE